MKDPRKKVISNLKEEFDVFKIQRIGNHSEILRVDFEYKGQRAYFTYTLIGEEGIDLCTYEEADDEDIYGLIHDWIGENIYFNLDIYFNKKKIGYGGIELN